MQISSRLFIVVNYFNIRKNIVHGNKQFLYLFVICNVNAGLFWKLMNQLPTTTVDNFYLEMMATFTFSQGMEEWLEIRLESLEMLRTSKMVILSLKI